MTFGTNFLKDKYAKQMDIQREEYIELNALILKLREMAESFKTMDASFRTAGVGINAALDKYEQRITLLNIPEKVVEKMLAYLILDQKIKAIKYVRAELGIGLKMAKEFVDTFEV